MARKRRRRGTGIEDDTYCHLIDAWVQGEMTRASDDEVDAGVDSLREFEAMKGDRFADADDLAEAIEDWKLFSGGEKHHPTTHRVLADLLAMWREIERP